MQAPEPIGARPVFSAGDRSYTWADVIAAAETRGDVATLRAQVATGSAALGQIEVGDEAAEAGVEFRRRLGLLSADEMQAWLEHWHLTAAEWIGYLRRSVALERLPSAPAGEQDGDPTALWAEAVCSGALGGWAWELAGRVAAGGDAAYEALVRSAATPEARAKALEAKQVEWLRVDFDELALPTEGMAREAVLCVRDDRMPLEEVARAAGAQVVERSMLLEDAQPELEGPLLSAGPGDLVGPVATENRFLVALVRTKRPPVEEDPLIQELLTDEVPRRLVDSEVKKQIRWHEHV